MRDEQRRGSNQCGGDCRREMGSGADSDASISWEDFIGTTATDLVPQLLGMFDELARAKSEPHHYQQQQQQQQQQRHQKDGAVAQTNGSPRPAVPEMAPAADDHELAAHPAIHDKTSPSNVSPAPLRYSGRRCDQISRPVSASSITSSSTSSSGCSNQGTASSAANPYLASVESLADTCASSQGSGDSGVVTTVSESGAGAGGRLAGIKIRLEDVDRATAARYFDERRPRYCDPHRSPVERVLLEIVDTEAVYVEHLRQVIQGYLIFWRDDPASLIRDSELSGLFSNIEDIYEFNRNFLSALEPCGLDPIAVANTFTEHNSGFEVYTEYCTNYPRTMSILMDLMSEDELARAFRERQAALGHDLPLGSFLLKPVQRILKYHLLLESLSKQFGSEEDASEARLLSRDREAVEGALKAMTGIAEHINAMKRKHEHSVRVQEIQSLLYGWPGPDLTTSGELIAEGSFRMRGAKAPRHAFLFDRMLLLTKRREDGLLVYKAHILCSNLTLMESIPGEPLCFNVIPFDNSQLQYKLQARNLEQKREWTLQIKRVILENYTAVIPSHARQLVLQIGQNRSEDDATPGRGHKKSSDYYYENRKLDRERRKSEAGFKQKLKKGRKNDISISTAENSPMCPRKNQSAESIHFGSRDENLNRSSEVRGSKIKDRFTNWRRKSEPGFQSYVNLNQSDNETTDTSTANMTQTSEFTDKNDRSDVLTESEEVPTSSSTPSKTKESTSNESPIIELKTQQSVEEIVGNIVMQKEEFQRRLDKHQQRNHSNLHNSIVKHGYERFIKISPTIDSSEDDDSDNENKTKDASNNRLRSSHFSRREQCFVRAVNAYNQRSFRSQYDSFRNVDARDSVDLLQRQNSAPMIKSTPRSATNEKRSPPDSLRKPNIVTESKVIRTALRIREHYDSPSEHEEADEVISETSSVAKNEHVGTDEKGSGYDNVHNAWEGCLDGNSGNGQDSPNKAAVWLTKLCEGLPDQPQKCGSLPRSFQMMNPADLNHVSKSRFLQRDGKSMNERPFTIASDKPAEINLEDMERYASTCQGSSRIAKFPTSSASTSSSTFFCSLDDASFTDTDSTLTRPASLSMSAHVHPDHKIYRANGVASKELNNGTVVSSTSSSLLSVFTKASHRLQQGLKSSHSTETLECSEETEHTRYFRSFSKRNKHKINGTKSSSELEELVGNSSVSTGNTKLHLKHLPYHKQGSSSLGARIAQSDYADPAVLFSDSRRNLSSNGDAKATKEVEDEQLLKSAEESGEGDSFYERSFETIENYVEAQPEEAFRDSAIFSDVDDSSFKSQSSDKKAPPPVPHKKKIKRSVVVVGEKPALAQKPAHLKLRAKFVKSRSSPRTVPVKLDASGDHNEDDVSAGQSQVGWVKKMVGQLQAQVDV